jgi:NADPH:quinone reductase-like Zn-dependent oxidoreductase
VKKKFGGADVVLDNMGAAYLSRNIDVLAPDGTLVVIGMQGGTKGELNLGKLLAKRGRVTATGLRGRPDHGKSGKTAIVAAVREHLWPLIEEAKVQPVVHAELPIAEAARGHELLDSPETVGKVVLRVRGS